MGPKDLKYLPLVRFPRNIAVPFEKAFIDIIYSEGFRVTREVYVLGRYNIKPNLILFCDEVNERNEWDSDRWGVVFSADIETELKDYKKIGIVE